MSGALLQNVLPLCWFWSLGLTRVPQCKSMGFFLPGESNWKIAGVNSTRGNSWAMNHHSSYSRSIFLIFIFELCKYSHTFISKQLRSQCSWTCCICTVWIILKCPWILRPTLNPCPKHACLMALCAAWSMQEVSNRSTVIQKQGLVYNLFASVISYSN